MTIVLAHTPHVAAEAAFDAALAEAALRGSILVLVNATRGDALVDTHFASQDALASYARRAEEHGVVLEIERPVQGDVVDAVLDVVERRDAELMVIGLRKRSPLGKVLLGSVAQQLLLTVDCPVLAVKAG
jgi:nucleotide-binding universal stress UspA family protein